MGIHLDRLDDSPTCFSTTHPQPGAILTTDVGRNRVAFLDDGFSSSSCPGVPTNPGFRRKDLPGLLSIAQAATLAGLSDRTIRRAVALKSGTDRLPASNVGLGTHRPTWRIKPSDLEAWMDRDQGTPTPRPRSVATPRGKFGHFKF